MKKIKYIISLLIIASTILISCKKFLEKEPIGIIGKNTLFATVEGARSAVNGSYNLMLYYYKNEFGMYADIASDNLIRAESTSLMLQQFNFQSSSDDEALAVGHIWLNIFETLNNTNNILGSLPALTAKFPEETHNLEAMKGEALVMRALCHFDLSRVYAQSYKFTSNASHLGIPILLKTPSPGEPVTRNTMEQTYSQIIKDLNDALPYLQKYANHTTQLKISYQAALALLSRVHLYKEDWQQSVNYANMVINDTNYQLATATDYKNIFINTPEANASTKVESIFALTNNGLNNGPSNIFSVYSDVSTASYLSSGKIRSSFESDDIRLTSMFTLATSGKNAGKSLTTKYGLGSVSTVNPPMIQVIRLSEVYLNRAEAKWNLGLYAEAKADLLIIAKRARPTLTDISYSSPTDLSRQIAEERNRELCFEGHRFFDLARRKEKLVRGTDCNASVCLLDYPNDKFVLPIPRKETEANRSLIQNPGFN